ncbi:MAG: type I glyceraldehyde-3-phosphate dehydrogenase [Chloroflexi bacterium]|nr:type I glyceraldehyde-3-phosphate dehydrogenase [Chloroflexota bacterium]
MTTSKLRVGINGFGRTGRQFMRAWWERHRDTFDVVAINGRTPVEMHTHLLRYDSDYGRFPAEVSDGEACFSIEGHDVHVFEEDDPARISWGAVGVDVVVESTGAFRSREAAGQHLGDSVRKVIISAPGKDEDWMVILGVNQDEYDPARHHVISAGSCTTNCVVPVVKVLHDAFGIERGMMTTIHAYTRDQNLVDSKHSDLRRARAAGLNIVPTSTGAAGAVAQIVPELKGKLTGIAYRVPTPTVSVVDLATDLATSASAEEINAAFEAAADGPMKGILYAERQELVSTDFKSHPGSSIFDLPATMVVDGGRMAKTMAWYDNEYGYSCRLADLCALLAERGLE